MGPLFSFSQSERPTNRGIESLDARPSRSDTASSQLIKNYLAVTGGRQKHLAIRNVVATGTIKESTLERNFRLIETLDGKRHLTYHWTHLGRKHREVYVFDGLQSWKQVLEPEQQEAMLISGAESTHFSNHRWLLQPFILPTMANYVFTYQGSDKVAGRPAHLVRGLGKKDIPSWFYFDKETSLLTRWGGEGQIAGTEEPMDYRATQFKSFGGVILPSKIILLAEEAPFGRINFEEIETNRNLTDLSFFMPRSTVPILRQRPVAPN